MVETTRHGHLQVQKWIRLFEKHKKVRACPGDLEERSRAQQKQSKLCSFNIASVEPSWPVTTTVRTPGLVQGIETRCEYSISATFFHSRHEQFYGSTYTGQQYAGKRGELRMNEILYWNSIDIDDLDCYFVIEFLSSKYCTKSGTILEYGSCGWSLVNLYKSTGGICTTPIYRGTPRNLLYLKRGGIESVRQDTGRTGSLLHYSYSWNHIQTKENLTDDNYIVSTKLTIPGINYDFENCSIDIKDSIELKLSDIVVTCKSRAQFENDLLDTLSLPGNSNELGRKKVSFLSRKRKKREDEPRIIERKMKLSVSNGFKMLWSTEVNLSIRDDGNLHQKGLIEVKNAFRHHLCALICGLEYHIFLPSASTCANITTTNETIKVIIGYQVFLPFARHDVTAKERDENARLVVLPLTRIESQELFWPPATNTSLPQKCLEANLEASFNIMFSSDTATSSPTDNHTKSKDIERSEYNLKKSPIKSTMIGDLESLSDNARQEERRGILEESKEAGCLGDIEHQDKKERLADIKGSEGNSSLRVSEQKMNDDFYEKIDTEVEMKMIQISKQKLEGNIHDKDYSDNTQGGEVKIASKMEPKDQKQKKRGTMISLIPSRYSVVRRIESIKKECLETNESPQNEACILPEASTLCPTAANGNDPPGVGEIDIRHTRTGETKLQETEYGFIPPSINDEHVPLLITSNEKLRNFVKDTQVTIGHAQTDNNVNTLHMFDFATSKYSLPMVDYHILHESKKYFFIDLMKDYRGHFREQVIEAIIVDWYKQKSKQSFILGCIERQMEQNIPHARNFRTAR